MFGRFFQERFYYGGFSYSQNNFWRVYVFNGFFGNILNTVNRMKILFNDGWLHKFGTVKEFWHWRMKVENKPKRSHNSNEHGTFTYTKIFELETSPFNSKSFKESDL